MAVAAEAIGVAGCWSPDMKELVYSKCAQAAAGGEPGGLHRPRAEVKL